MLSPHGFASLDKSVCEENAGPVTARVNSCCVHSEWLMHKPLINGFWNLLGPTRASMIAPKFTAIFSSMLHNLHRCMQGTYAMCMPSVDLTVVQE